MDALLRFRRGWWLLVFSLLLSACQSIASPVPATEAPPIIVTVLVTPTPIREKYPPVQLAAISYPELRVNIGSYGDIFDPQKSSFPNEIDTLRLIYEGLTRLNENLETVPGAAKSWKYNFDATTLTFTLRPDLKYGDQTVLNAKRFEYALIRNIDPVTASEYGSITNDLIGAEEWQTADTTAIGYDRTRYVAALGIESLDTVGRPCQTGEDGYAQRDCLTLRLKFKRAAPYFHTIMSMWITYPAKEENIRDGGENWWNTAQYQVGNGPFILMKLEPFISSQFVPNPYYWREHPQYKLTFRYIIAPDVALEAYQQNDLDIITIQPEQLALIDRSAELRAQRLVYPGPCTRILKFGLQTQLQGADGQTYLSPFQDRKVREAFAYAFDAEGWAREVDQGLFLPTQTWIPPGYPGYDAEEANWGFNPEQAQATLLLSSYHGPERLNELNLKLTFSDTPRNRTRVEWLINNYQQHLGVRLLPDPVDLTVYAGLIRDPKTFPLLALQGWCGDYPDPHAWLSAYWKSDTINAQRQGYQNDRFDRLVQEADSETFPAFRLDLYRQAQRMLIQDLPAIFASHTTNHYLVKPWVKGVVQTPEDGAWPGSIVPASITIEKSEQ